MNVPNMSDLEGPQAVRMMYCYECKSLAKVEPYEGPHQYDVHLQRWIEEHRHGLSVEEHKGGRMFAKDPSQFDHSGKAGSSIEEQLEEEVRRELAEANQEVYALRDSLKEDAVKCHRKHGQPTWPQKPCPSYKDKSKRVGRNDVPEKFQQYQCTYCPYEETVNFEKRWRKGVYKK